MTESLGQKILKAHVTPDDLKTALLAIDDMEPEDRKGFTGRCLAIMSAFGLLERDENHNPEEPISEERFNRVNKVTAAQIRIEALISVVNDPKFKAWSFEVSNGKDDYIMLREDVLMVAAETPLHESNDPEDRSSFFDPEEFFEKLLSVSYEAGNG
ncbi:MAG: hypothetical protein GC137_10605 [Alphaproteobacteria bacterium]|nr:hypothetical protein [Alphaproteobacteria bacterium]